MKRVSETPNWVSPMKMSKQADARRGDVRACTLELVLGVGEALFQLKQLCAPVFHVVAQT